MSPYHPAPRFLLLLSVVIASCAAWRPRLLAADVTAPSPAAPATVASSTPAWDFFQFVDELPENISDLLPNKKPTGALRLYLRPSYGDLIRRDYVRLPFGGRLQVAENVEFTGELQSYFTHGLAGSAGYGLSGLLLGTKVEHLFPSFNTGGLSVGTNFSTPLSRPPRELTDGLRHLLPYLAITRPLVPQWHVLGYGGIRADFLQHTAMPTQFGKNQLHSDFLTVAVGAAREWPRVHVALTATLDSSALVSNERRQVFALRPEVVLPLRPATARTQVLFTIGSHAVWGPDGSEFGVSSSLRIESQLNGSHR